MVARAIGGLVSGVGSCTRSCMRELTVKENRGRAFALFGWSWAVGMLLGPLLGGFLALPAESMPWLRGSLFDTYPYLLPCVAATSIYLLGLASLPTLRRELRAKGAARAAEAKAKAAEATAKESGRPGGHRGQALEMAAAAHSSTRAEASGSAAPAPAQSEASSSVLLVELSQPELSQPEKRPSPSAFSRAIEWLGSPVMLIIIAHFLLNLQVRSRPPHLPPVTSRHVP